jgi:hypothetical protein
MTDRPADQPLPSRDSNETTDREGPHFSKVTGSRAWQLAEVGNDEILTAIVKVATPGYVPESVRLRAAISQTIFTADLSRRRLAELEHDPQVVSVELSMPLRHIDKRDGPDPAAPQRP